MDVPSTLLTGEITALALRVSCAFAFAVNASATQKTLQRTLCNGQRGSHVYAWFFRSVSCEAVDAAALCCLLQTVYVACRPLRCAAVDLKPMALS